MRSDRVIKSRQEKIRDYVSNRFTTKKDQKAIEVLNYNSPAQMIDFMFESKFGLRLKPLSLTPSGKPSTGEEDLLKLKPKDKSGFIEALLENRGLEKLNSTYVEGMVKSVLSDGRIHASFLQHGTVTGRLSSRGPNLQNIPRPTTNPDIKKMFIPPPGYLLMEADYSQAELRVMAEWADEEVMLEWFATGKNVHVATACKMFGEMDRYPEIFAITKDEDHPEHDFWTVRKKKAKLVNFGILYGETAKKLSGQLGVSIDEAQEFMDQWFETFPRITRKIKAQHKAVLKNGYITNWFGRKRRLPAIWDRDRNFGAFLEAQRQSVNAFTQGTSSDFTQFSAILIRGMKLEGKLPSSMEQVYTVHDSLGFIIKPEDVHKVAGPLYDVCSNPATLKYFGFELKKVYMGVNLEIGRDWVSLRGYQKDEDYTKWL
jgi:DNA polymerase-1